jgi:SAM-dependent methyltransferase
MTQTGRDRGCLYEQAAVQQALGETFRPGGLDLTRRALDLCALPAGARVLDAACGLGATLRYICARGLRAFGSDLSAHLLHQAAARPTAARLKPAPLFFQADSACLPLADGQMDAALLECSLSVFAVLAPGGFLVISDLYARSLDGLRALQSFHPTGCLAGMTHAAEMDDRLTACGLTPWVWEDHSDLLKEMLRRLAVPSELAAEPAQPPLLAQLCGIAPESGLDALDVQLLAARARPGYFLAVARKN